MLKKELQEELKGLQDAVKAKYNLTDPGVDRLVARYKRRSLGLYPVKLHYKCDYEFKGQKCTRRFIRTERVASMGTHDAMNELAGVYYKYPYDHGACCPGCGHWVKHPVQLSCQGDKMDYPEREE